MARVVSTMLVGFEIHVQVDEELHIFYQELKIFYNYKREETLKLITWRTRFYTHTVLVTRSLEAFQHRQHYHMPLVSSIKSV